MMMAKGKTIRRAALIAALLLMTLALTACGKSVFGLTENTEKRMTLEAGNADRGDFFMVGSLEVEEGEQIVITSDLKKGEVRVELIRADAEQSIDKLPETDGEPTVTANLKNSDGASATAAAGSYLLRATCLEKASGTVLIEVKPAA